MKQKYLLKKQNKYLYNFTNFNNSKKPRPVFTEDINFACKFDKNDAIKTARKYNLELEVINYV